MKSLYKQMVRITITPTWAKVIDFETTLPSAVQELMATTHPSPFIDLSSIAVRALSSHSRPTNVDVRAVVSGRRPLIESSSYAGTAASVPLIRTSRRSLRSASRSTSRAVDSLTMTPPADATDSIRCAIPT